MKNDVLDIINIFNENNINYFIIRDYQNLDDILNSKDIDIYIDRNNKKLVNQLLKKNGWIGSQFNNSKYPHNQYFKMSSSKINMLDIVYGFYYGKRNFKLDLNKISKTLYDRKLHGINIANEKVALLTMLLHIVFDKEKMTSKNLRILKQMYLDYANSNDKVEEIIEKIVIEIVNNDIDNTNDRIGEYQKILVNRNLLYKNTLKSFIINVYVKSRMLLNKVKKRISKKSIAFIGMDGSGKSSTINNLKQIYGDKAVIVYMGLKEFHNKKLNKLVENNDNNFMDKLIKRILLFKEMYCRYLQYRFSGKVILFDRYLDDIIIASPNSVKMLDIILFKYLFPSPKLKVYLYCSAGLSYQRKDDITNKKLFEHMKSKFDKYYENNKKVFKISTDALSEIQVLDEVTNILNENLKTAIF